MLSALLAGALIVVASLLLGSAILAIAGLPRHSPAVPAAGLSALLVVCGVAVKLPGHAVTAAVVVGVALVGCFIVFGRTTAPAGSFRIGAIVDGRAMAEFEASRLKLLESSPPPPR